MHHAAAAMPADASTPDSVPSDSLSADSPARSSLSDAAPLRARTGLLFGLGDWGPSTATAAFMFFFPFFLTDVARLPPAYAAPVLLLGGAWDALNVPLVGALSDRTRTRWGRRRPFLLFGAAPFAVAFAMLWFVAPLGLPPLARAGYYALAYVLYDTAFSFVAVPYAALTPELARDYHERTRLNAYRSVVSMVGGLVTAVAAPAIVGAASSPRAGYQTMAVVLGALGAVPFLLLFAFVRERAAPRVAGASGAGGLREVFAEMRGALGNRAFRIMAAIYLCAWVTVSLVAAMFEYYVTYCFGLHAQLPVLLGVVQVAALASVPGVVWLAGRVGKRGALAIGALWWAGVLLCLAVLPARSTTLGYALAVAVGPGLATAHVVPWSMIPDVIEQDERATGRRREGMFYGLLALVQKAGAAVALAALQAVLAAAGYVAGGAAQSARTLAAIRVLTGPLPAALLVGAALLAWRFPLERARAAR